MQLAPRPADRARVALFTSLPVRACIDSVQPLTRRSHRLPYAWHGHHAPPLAVSLSHTDVDEHVSSGSLLQGSAHLEALLWPTAAEQCVIATPDITPAKHAGSCWLLPVGHACQGRPDPHRTFLPARTWQWRPRRIERSAPPPEQQQLHNAPDTRRLARTCMHVPAPRPPPPCCGTHQQRPATSRSAGIAEQVCAGPPPP